MGKKVDYKKDFKHLSFPKPAPNIVEIETLPFAMVSGSGNPDGAEFSQAVEALYSFSHAVKMSYKNDDSPAGYYDYTLFPLEAIWDLVVRLKPPTEQDDLEYTIMMRQPDFLTGELFAGFLERVKKEKSNPFVERLAFGNVTDGVCCQMMHLGKVADEPESLAKMEAYCVENGYVRISTRYREIYLSDPRKTEPSQQRTVLRFPVLKT